MQVQLFTSLVDVDDHETNSEHNFAHIKATKMQYTFLQSSEQGEFFMFYYSHLSMQQGSHETQKPKPAFWKCASLKYTYLLTDLSANFAEQYLRCDSISSLHPWEFVVCYP